MYASADPGGLIARPPIQRLTGALVAYLAGAPQGDKRHNQMLGYKIRDTWYVIDATSAYPWADHTAQTSSSEARTEEL